MVPPIASLDQEIALVGRQAKAVVERVGAAYTVDAAVLEALVTAFRDLRSGRSVEGWAVEKPSTVMSTAEAVAVTASIGLAAAYFPGDRPSVRLVPEPLLGVVRKDDEAARARQLTCWDGTVRRRAEAGQGPWRELWECRGVLEG
ncbi:hypothetical protein GCM10009558_057230 [Virgisporangium aurantiacum]